jgi:hypothetical protein
VGSSITRRGRGFAVWLGLFLLAISFVVGCSKGGARRGAIAGTVTLDGKPIAKGSIMFVPAEGTAGPVAGGPIENGRYQLPPDKGAAVGWNGVEIRSLHKTGRMVPKPMAPPGDMVEEYGEAVAPRYNLQSTLRFDVKPGENAANFEVTSK